MRMTEASTGSPVSRQPVVLLTTLTPPFWNGVKADVYMENKFIHIMKEANISDELTQLCYLQNPDTVPKEFQTLISDCLLTNEVSLRRTHPERNNQV